MKKIELKTYKDDHKFSIGTFIRMYNVHSLAADKAEDDYYDYMIADIPGESNFKLITNVSTGVTKGKSGYALAMVKTIANTNWVSAASLKYSIGVDDIYIIEY